jgi:membrane protein implicated in regulation of membrane protease activity
LSAAAYAVLAYGVFRLWRTASVAAIAFVWWQILVTPQVATQGAFLLVIITAILSTGVVASFRYRSNAPEEQTDAPS